MLYAAERIDTAFAESVIHDGSLFDRKLGAYSVAASRVRQRQIVTFKRRHGDAELRLADLCGENLKALGLNADLITGDDYRACQAWARKIHDDPRELDGIAYPSRQHTGHRCYAIFDRCGLRRDRTMALTEAQLTDLCALFNVAVQEDVAPVIAPSRRIVRHPRRRGA